jgi:hypothetical protein
VDQLKLTDITVTKEDGAQAISQNFHGYRMATVGNQQHP